MCKNHSVQFKRSSCQYILTLLCLVFGTHALQACSSHGPTQINVHLIGSLPETDAVKVIFSVNNTTDPRSPYTFQKNTTFFGIKFPDQGIDGTVNIGVELYSAQCLIGAGQNQVNAQSGQTLEIDIVVTPKVKTCPLTVLTNGEGVVSSDIPGINCSNVSNASCTGYFEFGKTVKLTATPGISGTSYLWGGKCSGSVGCDVIIDGASSVNVDFAPRVCTPAGFCWEYPRPQGASLSSVWTAPDLSMYAVGDAGTIFHGNGITWSSMTSSTQQTLTSIWGQSDKDIWAAGENVILHWNGSAWIKSTIPIIDYFNGIWSSSAVDAWAVGSNGTILHYDGTKWTTDAFNAAVRLSAVWGTSANDVWIIGDNGVTLHNTGTGWVNASTMSNIRQRAISGTGPGDVWAVGEKVRRWNGSTWLPADKGLTYPANFTGIWASGANTVWALRGSGDILRWDGNQWSIDSNLSPTAQYIAISGSGTSAWAVGSSGTISQLVSGVWKRISSAVTSGFGFKSVWMNGLDDGWAVGGNGVLFHWNGLVWTAETAKVNPFDAYAIWGSGRDNVWVCGSGGTVIRYNGVSWVSVPLPAGVVITNGGLYDVSGSGPNDIWLVGTEAFKPIVLRWDGVNLVSMPAPPSASSVYASADGVYIAANNSGLYKFDGIAWNTAKVADASTVRGFGKELFIGGDNGLHTWNGSAWTQQFAGERFTTVYARGMGDAWAYGGPPTGNLSDQHLVHWNGISWVEFEKLPIWVKGIGSFGSKDLWVVGSSSGILHLRQ